MPGATVGSRSLRKFVFGRVANISRGRFPGEADCVPGWGDVPTLPQPGAQPLAYNSVDLRAIPLTLWAALPVVVANEEEYRTALLHCEFAAGIPAEDETVVDALWAYLNSDIYLDCLNRVQFGMDPVFDGWDDHLGLDGHSASVDYRFAPLPGPAGAYRSDSEPSEDGDDRPDELQPTPLSAVLPELSYDSEEHPSGHLLDDDRSAGLERTPPSAAPPEPSDDGEGGWGELPPTPFGTVFPEVSDY
jgi:hypothetical protein